jgi:hypothetical protein
MTTTIIDAGGRLWDGVSPSLRRKLRCSLAAPALLDIAVGDRGFVVLRCCGRGAVEVRYRPSRAKPMALLTAVQWLDRPDWSRIVLRPWPGEQPAHFMGEPADAIAYLIGPASAAQSTRRMDFQARRHPPAAIARNAAFGRIQEAWRAAHGAKDRGLMEAVIEASCGRYLEVIPQGGGARLVMDTVGNGYTLYGQGWKSIAVGGRFEDMPDYEYGQWAAHGYRQAFRSGQPIFEDVTAAVRLRRPGRLRLTYQRVILPLGGGDHPTLLLGATLNQRVTHLAVEPEEGFGDVLQ